MMAQKAKPRAAADLPSFLQQEESKSQDIRRSVNSPPAYILHRRSNYSFPHSSRFSLFPIDPLLGFPVCSPVRRTELRDKDFTRVDSVRIKDALILVNETSPFRRGNSSQTLREMPSTTPSSEGAISVPVNNSPSYRSQQQISETDSEGEKSGDRREEEDSMTKALREQIMAVHREYASARRDEWHLHSITPASSVEIAGSMDEDVSEGLGGLYNEGSRESEEDLQVEEGVTGRPVHYSETQASKNMLIHASKPICELKQLAPKVLPHNSATFTSTLLDTPSRLWLPVESPLPDSPLYRKIVFCEEHHSVRLIESREARIEVKQVDIMWSCACAGFQYVPKIEFSNVNRNTASRINYDRDSQLLFCRLCSVSVMKDLVKKEVRWVTSGFEHNVVVTTEGLVYTWGHGAAGCLGHGDTVSVTFPKLVERLRTKAVTYAECGGYHTAIVTDDGEVYTWGRADVHQLGISFSELSKDDMGYLALLPQRIDTFRHKRVKAKSIACGEAHTLVLDSEGTVYAFGWAEDGQLGLPVDDLADGQMTHKVKDIRALHQTKIIKISAGSLFSTALTESGQVFIWGNGEQGQLGLGSRVTRADIPTLLTGLKSEWALDIVCGENFVLCLGQSGKIWGWGLGVAGHFENRQFVPGTDLACFQPRCLTSLEIDHRLLATRSKSRRTSQREPQEPLDWEGPYYS